MPNYIGVDVGTGSARAMLVDTEGTLLSSHSQPTITLRSQNDSRIFQQSTQNVWDAISTCVKQCIRDAGVQPDTVKGIGFDATCSLAVVDQSGRPVDVSPPEHGFQWGATTLSKDASIVPNIILWADHRAEEEAKSINATKHKVLDYLGGTMSLEMEIPKTLWLHRHMPREVFDSCQFFDLPDYLTYRATTSPARSTCSLVCKCSYLPPGVAGSTEGWSEDFLDSIGLDSLKKTQYSQLGGIPGKNGLVLTAGQPVGNGLSPEAAKDLGLLPGTAVGSGLIDAYAGWVGTVAASAVNDPSPSPSTASLSTSKHRLAAIAGTSTCYCVQSDSSHSSGIFVEGVWGPYKDVVFPGFWQNEGGQSSTGQLIDFIIDTHPSAGAMRVEAAQQGSNLFALLDSTLLAMQRRLNLPSILHLTKYLHLYPDLHGNRSPLADPSMKGLISGLTLSSGPEDLAMKYLATLEAIALQTRQIVEKMNAAGHEITEIYMSGSQAMNGTLMRLIALGCRVKVLIPEGGGSTAVVKGSAILARYAHEVSLSLSLGPSTTTTSTDSTDSSSSSSKQPAAIKDQSHANDLGLTHRDLLWTLMQTMTKPGHFVLDPTTSSSSSSGEGEMELAKGERKLLDVKYRIFQDMIEAQKRWRGWVDEALSGE